MKKQLITLLTIFTLFVLSCTAALAETGAAHTGAGDALSEVENTEKFYYTLDGQTVTVSLNGTLDFEEDTDKNIIISCYDGTDLLKAAVIPLSAAVSHAGLNDFDIVLPKVPQELTVRSFAWSGLNECAPLCDAAELSDIPANAYYVTGRVVKTKKTDSYLNSGKVGFRVEASENFEGEVIDDENEWLDYDMYTDNTDIEQHLFETVEAYIAKDADNEYHILKYTLTDSQQTISLTKSDIDLTKSDASKIVTTDNREIDISDVERYYINGVPADIYDNADILSFIESMPEKYNKIKLLNVAAADGKYDFILLESYSETTLDEIVNGNEKISLYFLDPVGNMTSMKIYLDDDYYTYSFYNEKMEECDISLLDGYVGKKVYIAYDYNDTARDSSFYDIILENAQPQKPAVIHNDRLTAVAGTAVLKYSDTDKTAMLDGELVFDSDGNMPYDINIDFIKDNESIATDTIKFTTAVKQITFGTEVYDGEERTFTGKKYPVTQRPDKAVISFNAGDDTDIPSIIVPVVSEDAYEVYGRVLGTARTDADLSANQVTFRVEKSDYFDGERITPNDEQTLTMSCGSTNAASFLREYAYAYIHKNAENDYTIEAITPIALNKSVTLSAEDFDAAKSEQATDKLYFYPHGETRNSVKYVISDTYEVYVNGVPKNYAYDDLISFIAGQSNAEIKLIKETMIGSTSSYTEYNLIMINIYGTAVVEAVEEDSDSVTLSFASYSAGLSGSMVVYTGGDDYECSFRLNGEAINPSELRANDVLSIAYDIDGGFNSSRFYGILVSRATAEGKCTSANSDGTRYTFGTKTYDVAADMNIGVDITSEYTLYLDVFGRIAYAEEKELPKQLAVFKNLYKKAGGDWYAQLITPEGEKEYIVNDANVTSYGKLLNPSFSGGYDAVDYYGADKAEKFAQQIIEYSISSSDKLIIRSRDSEGNLALVDGVSGSDKYAAGASRIGNVVVGADTVILDVSGDSVKTLTSEDLADGYNYTAYGYNKTNNGGYYRFVVLSEAPKTAVAVMEYYDGAKAYLYSEEDFLELQLSDEKLLDALRETRTDKKAAYVVHDYEKVLGVELLSPEKTTGIYQNGYIGEYQVPKHISCRYPEIGIERGVSACLIEGNSYDVLKYRKGGQSLTVIDGEIDETRDKFTGILTSAYDNWAIITDTDGNTNTYRIPDHLSEVFTNVNAPVGICYDYSNETLSQAELLVKADTDITGTYQNGKIGTYTVPEYVYYYDEGDNRAYKIPSSALVADEEYTVARYSNDNYEIEFIIGSELAKGEELKCAIVKNFYRRNGGDWCIQIINEEGEEEEYKVSDYYVDTYKSLLNIANSDGTTYGWGEKVERYPNQVIQYSIDAIGRLYINGNAVLYGADVTDEYIQSASKIGSVKIGDDTVILDISDADDDKITRITKEQLIDGVNYTVCGYDRAASGDRYYRYVLITRGTLTFNSTVQLAVFKSAGLTELDGDTRDTATVLIDGEEKQYVVSEYLSTNIRSFAEGDALMFITDYNNEITDIAPVFSANRMLEDKDWYDFADTAIPDLQSLITNRDWNALLQDGKSEEMDIVFGVVVNKTNSSITLCKTLDDNKYANYDTGLQLDCSDAKVYTYDFGVGPNKSKLYTDYSLMATPDNKAYRTTNSKGQDILDVTNAELTDDLVFAVARTDGDTVREIYQLVNWY